MTDIHGPLESVDGEFSASVHAININLRLRINRKINYICKQSKNSLNVSANGKASSHEWIHMGFIVRGKKCQLHFNPIPFGTARTLIVSSMGWLEITSNPPPTIICVQCTLFHSVPGSFDSHAMRYEWTWTHGTDDSHLDIARKYRSLDR